MGARVELDPQVVIGANVGPAGRADRRAL